MRFRPFVFWLHLICGVVAGAVIGVMSFTGVLLAFEKQIVAWADHDVALAAPPASGAARVSLDELMRAAREKFPDAPVTGVVVSRDPRAAVSFNLGREGVAYADPYTGAVRGAGARGVRQFMRVVTDWHRWLGVAGERRPVARAVTGACNLVFLVLALTGLYIWLPRQWSWRALRPIVWFSRGKRGRARDWSWHNVIGLWSAPVLIVLTVTGAVISYRWASDLVFRVAGSEPPAAGGPPGAGGARVAVPATRGDARPLGYEAWLTAATQAVPDWEQISFRLGGPGVGGAARSGEARGGENRGAENRGAAQPVSVTVRTSGQWPAFGATTLALDPFTGTVLRREDFSDQNAGRRARSWMRFLHTGEAFGAFGQFVAMLASAGAVVLVYTGLALAYRRFFRRNLPVSPGPAAP